jgi:hypothetical protein
MAQQIGIKFPRHIEEISKHAHQHNSFYDLKKYKGTLLPDARRNVIEEGAVYTNSMVKLTYEFMNNKVCVKIS